jgi:hypothetical protein
MKLISGGSNLANNTLQGLPASSLHFKLSFVFILKPLKSEKAMKVLKMVSTQNFNRLKNFPKQKNMIFSQVYMK